MSVNVAAANDVHAVLYVEYNPNVNGKRLTCTAEGSILAADRRAVGIV